MKAKPKSQGYEKEHNTKSKETQWLLTLNDSYSFCDVISMIFAIVRKMFECELEFQKRRRSVTYRFEWGSCKLYR